jgi:signal transduction histidine kinase
MRRLAPWTWAGLLAVAAAAELAVLWPMIGTGGGDPVSGPIVVFDLVGGSFVVCGLVAWRRRPDSRSGALMTASGFAFLVPAALGQRDEALATTLASLFGDLWIVGFVALMLTALTSGRLRSRVDRALVGAFILPALALQFVLMLFAAEDGNLILVIPDAGVADAVDTAQRALLVGACGAAIAVVAARWRTSSPPRRRALLPSVAGAACLVAYAALLATDLVAGSRSQALLWLAAVSLVSVPVAFLAGLLRSRLARGGLAQLFSELSGMRGVALESALSRTLGDPTLVLAHRLPGSRGHADAEGRPVLVPPVTAGRATAAIEHDGDEIASLVYDSSLDDDPEMVEAVRAAAAMALGSERLHAESEARLAEVQASRQRIVAAGDAERRRLERDLHDGAQQRLVALSLQLRMIRSDIRRNPEQAEQLAVSASDELAHSLKELRELARGIHPAALDHGLASALESLATRSTVATAVSCDAPEGVPPAVELAVYFVACEALANVGKYADATAASVRLSRTAGGVAIEIADDGVGGADAGNGSGLHGLADRVEALDGHLFVTSPSGAGTVIIAELPCAS